MRNQPAEALKPRLLALGEAVVGPTSPVVRATVWLVKFFANDPVPDLGREVQEPARGLATHLLHLLQGASAGNLSGWHSVAASLLRSLEDALDCFAAVTIVPSAAKKWCAGRLRPSDAAKAWTPLVHDMVAKNVPLPEYRRLLREMFNDYAHCCPELCAWNLYFLPKERNPQNGAVAGTLEPNLGNEVIESNAHAIDAHLTGHLLEFLVLVRHAYAKEINRVGDVELLAGFLTEISEIMMKHDNHGCQEVRPPPEVRRLQFHNSAP